MNYIDERFADIQLLRYRLPGFEQLSLLQKKLIYYLSKATLYGRDITYDQNCKDNLRIRKTLEAIYTERTIVRDTADFRAFEIYLKCVWFANGIHHHYGSEKFEPAFSQQWFRDAMLAVSPERLPLYDGETIIDFYQELSTLIFDKLVHSKRVNKDDGDDLVQTSACHFYEGVTQEEAERFYCSLKEKSTVCDGTGKPRGPESYGLNSTLVKDEDGQIYEDVWCTEGRYAKAIQQIVYWIEQACTVAENEEQRQVMKMLIEFYRSGDLQRFNDYCIAWVSEQSGRVDFINGFIEVYGDPLGLKGTWEGLVEYKDWDASRRTQTISNNAQWFEDHSPVDSRFRKPKVKGVSAHVVCAAMLGGDEYPSTAIGINLPNADWIRSAYGSKSVSISNITDAYHQAARSNGFKEEFVIDHETCLLIERYDNVCDVLHTDLHECLGHGSGQLLPGTNPDALKAYGDTIEEARADLFGLYYMADPKLVELGLLPDGEAYKAQYYSYMMNGLMTQLTRVKPGRHLEEAHMRNRALIAHWCLENGDAVRLERHDGKTYVRIIDYPALRDLIATLLAEIQRIKSEGDYEAARQMVECYGVQVDSTLHKEVLMRYEKLQIAPYKGFINPRMTPVVDRHGEITDITLDYEESFEHQMLRYSTEYGTLI